MVSIMASPLEFMHHFVIALARRHQRPDIRPRVDDDMARHGPLADNKRSMPPAT